MRGGDHRRGSSACALVHEGSLYRRRQLVALSAPPARKSHPSVKDETAAKIVSHLDSQYREGTRAFVEKLGVPFLPPPAVTLTKEGDWLAPNYYYEDPADPHHANVEYGILACAQMREVLSNTGHAREIRPL